MVDIAEIQWPDTPFPIEEHLVMAMVVGSESHGLKIPNTDPDSIDDKDIMAVVMPPARYYLGLSRWEGASSIKGEWDVVLYEYRKYVSLLMKQNPNVIGTLWLDDYIYTSDIGTTLVYNRDLFKHRRLARDSFLGYANSQLKKMTSGAFKGYMGAKRKELVERFGFDVKNGSHLIRLLHMGLEYLETGRMEVRRTWDRQMLMDIKKGLWTLERVKEYSEAQFARVHAAYDISEMQEEIPFDLVEGLVINSLEQHLNVKVDEGY